MDLADFQKHLDKLMHERNNQGIPDFEGYSPSEMRLIFYDSFSKESPLQFQKLNNHDYDRVPMFNQIKYLARLLAENGEIKLTDKGYLPTRIVKDLYAQGFIKDEFIESGLYKLFKETDAMAINLTRMLSELSGLIKKRNGKISLTKPGVKILADNSELLQVIFKTMASKFNWAYYDGYGNNSIGQLGYGFSLILLSKYGQVKRSDSFYAENYFKAFPWLLDGINPPHSSLESFSTRCYSTRTFSRFLDYFGLIRIEVEGKPFVGPKSVTKTALFDKFIQCRPPSRS